ncbi:MAG: hypothetical protein VX311_13035, partial [Planctomycetota bacterium]|nr:hypothetical protein [Planctomycetota bacterium]
GLGRSTGMAGVLASLRKWTKDPQEVLRREALRSLRSALAADSDSQARVTGMVDRLKQAGKPTTAQRDLADRLATALVVAGNNSQPELTRIAGARPGNLADWERRVAGRGSVAAGRRLFFHNAGPRCGRCHMVNGRGRRVGPDLSLIARSRNRRQLLESILLPSREVAPQFTSWTLVTIDGRVLNGVIVYENRDRLTIEDADGKQTNLANTEVEMRTPQKKSLMPEKLIDRLAITELRDLLSFLETLK